MGPLGSDRTGLLALNALSISFMIGMWPAADAFGAITIVASGADLQAALNAARPGDVLVLQAGARYVGTFKLPANTGGAVITIRSSATLPDRRIGPEDANLAAHACRPCDFRHS
jgi:hypothetical protein